MNDNYAQDAEQRFAARALTNALVARRRFILQRFQPIMNYLNKCLHSPIVWKQGEDKLEIELDDPKNAIEMQIMLMHKNNFMDFYSLSDEEFLNWIQQIRDILKQHMNDYITSLQATLTELDAIIP